MATDNLLSAPVEVAPAYAAVVERLRRSIALGLLLPGEKLPPERTLAEKLGVSRVTVREALRVLQGEGLIATKRGGSGGAVVVARDVTLEQLRSDLQRSRPQIDEVYEFRLAVETMAARLAAARRSDEDLQALSACQQALLDSEDTGGFRRADSEFHLALASASGNPMLRAAIEDARAATFDWFDVHPFRVLRETSAAGHAAVIAAIDARDADAAAEAMAAHLRASHDEVLAALKHPESA